MGIQMYRIAAYPRLNIDWSKVDWSKSSKEIAQLFGTTTETASRYRRKHAPNTVKESPLRGTIWENLDWSKSNQEVAEQLGIKDKYYSYIAKQRRKYAPLNLGS